MRPARSPSWSHRVAGDRVTPYMDPVRYEQNKGRDGILMGGADMNGYDVPNQLDELIYKDTGVRTSPLRGTGNIANRFASEGFLDEIARKQGKDPIELAHGAAEEAAARAASAGDAWRRWPTGSRKRGRRHAGIGIAYIDYTGISLAGIGGDLARPRAPARSRCTTSGARSTSASPCSPTTWSRRRRAASSTASASR